MKSFKSHFVFSKSQQNGIFLLVLIIVVLQLVYFFVDFPGGENSKFDRQESERLQQHLDSLKQMAASGDTLKIYPFNPNYISDFKGYSLGMTPEEIDKLQEYRAREKWVNSSEEFQRVTGVSDSLLAQISPYFKFPEWVSNRKPAAVSGSSSGKKVSISVKDINSASAEDLKEINGIGETLSERILNYRTKIGGFRDILQLKDVWGLNADLRRKIEERFGVVNADKLQRANLNTITALELSEIPYFDYELAREITDYRSLHDRISSFEELAKIKGFPSDKIDRIKLYLTLD